MKLNICFLAALVIVCSATVDGRRVRVSGQATVNVRVGRDVDPALDVSDFGVDLLPEPAASKLFKKLVDDILVKVQEAEEELDAVVAKLLSKRDKRHASPDGCPACRLIRMIKNLEDQLPTLTGETKTTVEVKVASMKNTLKQLIDLVGAHD